MHMCGDALFFVLPKRDTWNAVTSSSIQSTFVLQAPAEIRDYMAIQLTQLMAMFYLASIAA